MSRVGYTREQQYWIWLSSVEGMDARRFDQLLDTFENPQAVWENESVKPLALGAQAARALQRARSSAYFDGLFEAMERAQVRAVTRLDPEYPQLLLATDDAPPTLFVRGRHQLNDERTFAIVGTRQCTRDGARAASEIAQQLALEGVTVVSGMARGIDTRAQVGCLAVKRRTVAVLGCGVDVVYPPENGQVMEGILECGGSIISEYPLGVAPLAHHFPARNRIISGMCAGVLLVEGAKASGGMITVNYAQDQGREVFAVPGSIYAPQSYSPNRLIQSGATPVLSPWDILEAMRWGVRPSVARQQEKGELMVNEEERQVVEPLINEELSFGELARKTNFSVQKLNSLLTTLELRGIIKRVPGNLYRFIDNR